MGIAPRFFDEPGILLKDYGQLIFTETMSERKTLMEDKAEAFIALPGGIGTYEEFFETLTLKQLGRHSKPMALLNTLGYFDPMVEMLEKTAESGS
ncbi:MAG: LOG family protein [Oscillospiraceae bacterium]